MLRSGYTTVKLKTKREKKKTSLVGGLKWDVVEHFLDCNKLLAISILSCNMINTG